MIAVPGITAAFGRGRGRSSLMTGENDVLNPSTRPFDAPFTLA